MVLMALSLLSQVGCFSTGLGLRVSCLGSCQEQCVWVDCCFTAFCVVLFFLDVMSVCCSILETAE